MLNIANSRKKGISNRYLFFSQKNLSFSSSILHSLVTASRCPPKKDLNKTPSFPHCMWASYLTMMRDDFVVPMVVSVTGQFGLHRSAQHMLFFGKLSGDSPGWALPFCLDLQKEKANCCVALLQLNMKIHNSRLLVEKHVKKYLQAFDHDVDAPNNTAWNGNLSQR